MPKVPSSQGLSFDAFMLAYRVIAKSMMVRELWGMEEWSGNDMVIRLVQVQCHLARTCFVVQDLSAEGASSCSSDAPPAAATGTHRLTIICYALPSAHYPLCCSNLPSILYTATDSPSFSQYSVHSPASKSTSANFVPPVLSTSQSPWGEGKGDTHGQWPGWRSGRGSPTGIPTV